MVAIPPEVRILTIECPECHQHIKVPLSLAFNGIDKDGNLEMLIDADYADLWAHVWVHQEESND